MSKRDYLHGPARRALHKDGKVIIEDDNIEDGLAPTLHQAGIPDEDILLSWRLDHADEVARLAV